MTMKAGTGVENQHSPYYNHYREFWQDNLQKLKDLTRALDMNVSGLETKYRDFDTLYNAIVAQIDVLSSIYSGYNSLLGRDYVLKLKALLRDYRARYTLEGVNFNLIHFLQMKIRDNLEKSFDEYPRLHHRREKKGRITPNAGIKKSFHVPAYQWHTFCRNGSWIIVPCTSSKVYVFSDIQVAEGNDPKRFSLPLKTGEVIPITDLFASPTGGLNKIHFVLLIQHPGGKTALAADRAGKKIMAEHDFITPILQDRKKKGMVKGSVRLFGKRHFLIDPGILF